MRPKSASRFDVTSRYKKFFNILIISTYLWQMLHQITCKIRPFFLTLRSKTTLLTNIINNHEKNIFISIFSAYDDPTAIS